MKSLESCLVWKSQVMNNASVSIIKSVLIKWISPAPEDGNTHTAAPLTNQRKVSGVLNLTFLCPRWSSRRWSSHSQLRLVIYAHESTFNEAAPPREQLIYTQLLISWIALLLMKTHRSIQQQHYWYDFSLYYSDCESATGNTRMNATRGC